MSNNLAIVLVATNYYFSLGIRFINRWSYLYEGNLNVTFHFYSESDPSEYLDKNLSNVIFHKMTTKSWPEADVSRIYEIIKLKNYNYDHIYIFDADTNIKNKFNDYLFKNNITAYQHWCCELFEKDSTTASYFEYSDKDIWYQTCLLGGNANSMIEMCESTLPWIDVDKQNNYTPHWIAEAYFNKYLHFNPPQYTILRNKKHPFIMSDKGNSNTEKSGADARPFIDITDEYYNNILKNIKNNKSSFWDIKNNQFVIDSVDNIKRFENYV